MLDCFFAFVIVACIVYVVWVELVINGVVTTRYGNYEHLIRSLLLLPGDRREWSVVIFHPEDGRR